MYEMAEEPSPALFNFLKAQAAFSKNLSLQKILLFLSVPGTDQVPMYLEWPGDYK